VKHVRFSLLLVLLAACAPDALVETRGELEVEPGEIDFGRVWIGDPAERPVSFQNRGRARIDVELTVGVPFTLDETRFSLDGGASRVVRVRFDPEVEGEWESAIAYGAGEVPVRARAERMPKCPPSTLCREVSFDPVSGTCVEERLPEGTPCGDLCFAGACVEGECLGGALDCDDGNACTLDACDPATGCVHFDQSDICAEEGDPEDPCRVPICDPQVGCTFENAIDGTRCGPSDCTSSFVCLQGTCSLVVTPEGGACGQASPCREEGVCIKDECIQPPPVVLEPTWRREVAPGSFLVFDGVADPVGQVYWAECTRDGCDLISVTSRGVERYREAIFFEPVGRAPTGSLALAGDLLVSTLRPNRVEAFAASTAQRRWTVDLAAALGVQAGADRWVDEAAPPVVAPEVILVAVEGRQRNEGGKSVEAFGGWVVAIDRLTGQVRWTWSADGVFEGLVGDEGGSIYFALRDHEAAPSGGAELVSLGTTGAERWRRSTPFQAPLATLGGILVQASGEVRTTADGHLHQTLRMFVPSFPRRTPLASGRSLWTVGIPIERCDDGWCPTWVPHLFRFDLERGMELWRNELTADLMSEPVLTSDLSILYARRTGSRSSLVEFDAHKNVVFECELPPGVYDGPTALVLGQWITADGQAVAAFAVEKRSPPQSGWVTAGGTPERTARPR